MKKHKRTLKAFFQKIKNGKRFQRTVQAVLKSLFYLSSSLFCPHVGLQFLLTRISSLYVEFIQSRDSELIALLFQIHSSPESSGSPLESFTLLLKIKIKTISGSSFV